MLIFSVTLWHMSILFKVPLEDHPRVCGEQNQLLMDQVPIPGSPPCVRGTVHLCARSRRRSRITPAHPRVCGGSPPRVRGTEAARDAPEDKPGITPACAGNSCAPASPGPSAPDHPRVCGEQTMRGTGSGGVRLGRYHGLYRITPACAGNRESRLHLPYIQKDHPRVCGEQ